MPLTPYPSLPQLHTYPALSPAAITQRAIDLLEKMLSTSEALRTSPAMICFPSNVLICLDVRPLLARGFISDPLLLLTYTFISCFSCLHDLPGSTFEHNELLAFAKAFT